MTDSETLARTKRRVHDGLAALCAVPDDGLRDATDALYQPEADAHLFHPVDDLVGAADIAAKLWQPIRSALPDLERRDEILIAGEHNNRPLVATMGHLQGTFVEPLFGIPATHGVVHIRYGEIHLCEDDRIETTYMIADMLDLMRQAGCWPISPSLGSEGMWPGPATSDGVRPDVVDMAQGSEALELVRQMHAGLLRFDGKDIESMDHQQFWTRDFLWYGPSGIGTTRGLDGFRAHHQIPFLRAFPDRRVANHIGRVGDGNYVITGGWPSVVATHSGPDWLALAPTGKHVDMRVMDFYRVADGLIAENWVPIDIIDIMRQLGVDVFGRMRHLLGEPRKTL